MCVWEWDWVHEVMPIIMFTCVLRGRWVRWFWLHPWERLNLIYCADMRAVSVSYKTMNDMTVFAAEHKKKYDLFNLCDQQVGKRKPVKKQTTNKHWIHICIGKLIPNQIQRQLLYVGYILYPHIIHSWKVM